MESTCKICDEDIEEDDKKVVTCVICSCKFHAHYSKDNSTKNCASIIASEFKLVEMTKAYQFVYRCTECSKANSLTPKLEQYIANLNKNMEQILCGINKINNTSIPAMEKSIKDINEKLSPFFNETLPLIEKKIKDLENSQEANNKSDLEKNITIQVIQEVNQRVFKQKNLSMYNIPESPDSINDKQLVNLLIDNQAISKNIISISRIGGYVPGINRPTRVKAKYTEDIASILSNSLKIKDRSKEVITKVITNLDKEKILPVTCSNDRTKLETDKKV